MFSRFSWLKPISVVLLLSSSALTQAEAKSFAGSPCHGAFTQYEEMLEETAVGGQILMFTPLGWVLSPIAGPIVLTDNISHKSFRAVLELVKATAREDYSGERYSKTLKRLPSYDASKLSKAIEEGVETGLLCDLIKKKYPHKRLLKELRTGVWQSKIAAARIRAN